MITICKYTFRVLFGRIVLAVNYYTTTRNVFHNPLFTGFFFNFIANESNARRTDGHLEK